MIGVRSFARLSAALGAITRHPPHARAGKGRSSPSCSPTVLRSSYSTSNSAASFQVTSIAQYYRKQGAREWVAVNGAITRSLARSLALAMHALDIDGDSGHPLSHGSSANRSGAYCVCTCLLCITAGWRFAHAFFIFSQSLLLPAGRTSAIAAHVPPRPRYRAIKPLAGAIR